MVRTLLLIAAGFLLVTALVFGAQLNWKVAITADRLIPLGRMPMARMNMTNKLGDRDFYCMNPSCDDTGGFQGKQTGWLYANRIDAVLGKPMRTNQ